MPHLPGDIPHLPGELARQSRCEYVLDLERKDVLDGATSQYRRNVFRAARLDCRFTVRSKLLPAHNTWSSSMLQWNGEPNAARRSRPAGRSTTISVAGQPLGRTFPGSERGPLPEGMKLGASPFWVSRVAGILKEEDSCSSTSEAPQPIPLVFTDSKLDLARARWRLRRRHFVQSP